VESTICSLAVKSPAIPGNFFVYRDNATVGSLTSADDLVAAMTVTGTFNSAIDVIFVAPIFPPEPITITPNRLRLHRFRLLDDVC
jgi:hypothetical protein